MFSSFATSSHILLAFSTPSALQVLAFFELAITAIALLSLFLRLSFVTIMGAPLTLFCVYTAAVLHTTSDTKRQMSFLCLMPGVSFAGLLIPQYVPLALKPFAAQIPPSIYVNLLSIAYSPKFSPVVSSIPRAMLRHCIAAPLAPLPKLSKRDVIRKRSSFPFISISISSRIAKLLEPIIFSL